MSAFSIQLLIILYIIFSLNPISTTEKYQISSCTCNLFKMPVKNQRQYRLNKKRKRAQAIRDISRIKNQRQLNREKELKLYVIFLEQGLLGLPNIRIQKQKIPTILLFLL